VDRAPIDFIMLLDTTPDAARARWDVLAAMTGEARLRQALELTDFVYRVAADGRRARAADSAPDPRGLKATDPTRP
jgi:hypothetical protein